MSDNEAKVTVDAHGNIEFRRPYRLVLATERGNIGRMVCMPCLDGLHKDCDYPHVKCECLHFQRQHKTRKKRDLSAQRDIAEEFGTIDVK